MLRKAVLHSRGSLLRSRDGQRSMSSFVAVPFFQVDSFSRQPYGGNPAAVVLLPASLPPLTDADMAKLADENNLSETCFVVPVSEAPAAGFETGAEFNLRWFTPKKEVCVVCCSASFNRYLLLKADLFGVWRW